ncbi:MAG TPA: DMT family transporter [Steroidobacter sp.]|nr:DMT family transporter [Steroidobacteraceae bacterium]HLS82660.1 DMT family transporter [Steroidobacter sp.]
MSVSSPTASTHSPGAERSTPRWRTPLELSVLGAIWGASFLFMRVAADDFGPIPLVEMRLALGALMLSPFLWCARKVFTAAQWLKIVGVALINAAIPFVLFAWAAQRAPAGVAAIANATTVMFTVVVAFALYGERIGRRRAVGVLVGFIGAVVLASGKTQGDVVWQAALAATFGAALYGFGANLIRHHLTNLPPSAVAAATLMTASLVTAPLAALAWPAAPIPAASWMSAIALGLLCTGAAYLVYYRLLYRIGPSSASTVTYLVPVFGVLWAWVLLDEPVTLAMAVAGMLILGGVALSQRAG